MRFVKFVEVIVYRVIKFAAYALFGIALFECYRGMTAVRDSHKRRSDAGGSDLDPSIHLGVGTMTGPGEGMRVQTEDGSGTTVPHIVGRGVV